MSHMARKQPPSTDRATPDDEGSVIRPRNEPGDARRRQESSPELSGSPGLNAKRRGSGTRPASGSLDDRLEQKMRLADELMRHLPTSDTRVRLLSIAIMRRDESLLDGVLAELNKPAR